MAKQITEPKLAILCEDKKELEKYLKSKEFVEHIERHLKEHEVVICKICNKSIHEIYDEYYYLL